MESIDYLERYTAHDATVRLFGRLRVWLYGALEPLVPARTAAFRGGELWSAFVNDVDTLQYFYLHVLPPPASRCCSPCRWWAAAAWRSSARAARKSTLASLLLRFWDCDGGIVRRGRREELLARQGLYHDLWRLQHDLLAE